MVDREVDGTMDDGEAIGLPIICMLLDVGYITMNLTKNGCATRSLRENRVSYPIFMS